MSLPTRLVPNPAIPPEIVQAGLKGDLIIFVGAGTSMLLDPPLPSWAGMAEKQLQFLRDKGVLNDADIDALKESCDPKKQLSIAKLYADQQGISGEYISEQARIFEASSKPGDIYDHLNSIGCTFVTTNYDLLLNPQKPLPKSGPSSSTPVDAPRFDIKRDFSVNHLDSNGNVVHIHGSMKNANEMVVTTKDYLATYQDPNVRTFLNHLFHKKTVFFIGYGLEEAEILEHILRQGNAATASPTDKPRHFVLQGYKTDQTFIFNVLEGYYQDSFGVKLIGFSLDENKYKQQEEIIKDWATKITMRDQLLSVDKDFMDEVLENE